MTTADATRTAYHVFLETNGNGEHKAYEPAGANVHARSSNEAIKQTAKKPGTYVAIPARSFKPVKVSIQTETTIKLG